MQEIAQMELMHESPACALELLKARATMTSSQHGKLLRLLQEERAKPEVRPCFMRACLLT
jgi:hypothetical protein